jgi:hypothetical protein
MLIAAAATAAQRLDRPNRAATASIPTEPRPPELAGSHLLTARCPFSRGDYSSVPTTGRAINTGIKHLKARPPVSAREYLFFSLTSDAKAPPLQVIPTQDESAGMRARGAWSRKNSSPSQHTTVPSLRRHDDFLGPDDHNSSGIKVPATSEKR